MPHITQLPTILFYTFLSFIFLLEGFGWRGGRDASFVLLLVMPIFLFTLDFILKNKIHIPKIPTILYGGFIYFSYISTLFSVDISRSFPYLLFYISLYGVFLYVYNHQEELKNYLVPFIFILSFIFSIYSFFSGYIVSINPAFFYPENAAQYVISRYGSHNNLGTFLLIPLLICGYHVLSHKKKVLYGLIFLYFLPFFIFAYSRSAYLSFSLSLLILFVYLLWRRIVTFTLAKGILIVSIMIIFGILFFATTVEFRKITFFHEIHQMLVGEFHLQKKNFLANRQFLVYEAVESIKLNPILGVGPNNYLIVSQQSPLVPFANTDSSHNLFIDIFAENGIIAGTFYLLFLIYFFTKGKKNIFYFVSLAMLLNFQTMYTFRIYSFMLLFIVMLALIVHDGSFFKKKRVG